MSILCIACSHILPSGNSSPPGPGQACEVCGKAGPRIKPEWALMLGNALDLERQAEAIRQEALEKRCPAQESGGARCTADRLPDHSHRIKSEDLP